MGRCAIFSRTASWVSHSFPFAPCSSGQSGSPTQLRVSEYATLSCPWKPRSWLSEPLFYFCEQFPVLVGQGGLFPIRGSYRFPFVSLLQLYKFITLRVFWAARGQRSFLMHLCINACGTNEWKDKVSLSLHCQLATLLGPCDSFRSPGGVAVGTSCNGESLAVGSFLSSGFSPSMAQSNLSYLLLLLLIPSTYLGRGERLSQKANQSLQLYNVIFCVCSWNTLKNADWELWACESIFVGCAAKYCWGNCWCCLASSSRPGKLFWNKQWNIKEAFEHVKDRETATKCMSRFCEA